MMPYQNPLGLYVPYGSLTPACRRGERPENLFRTNFSHHRQRRQCPTAVIRSVGKIDTIRLYHGQSLNMRLDSSVFRVKAGIGRFVALTGLSLIRKSITFS